MISKEQLFLVTTIAKELKGTRTGEDLLLFGRNKFVEIGDIGGKSETVNKLIGFGLIFRIEHVGEFNSPDYGITHLGYQVFEYLQLDKEKK